ncbi:MAG: peptidoglycan DD-metalloendopeptidase family protein [Candidatus Taylorbacteria bacterium]|nr:peptidoglycan DD-metalloendopeptidase family protein [Candidatus Taylorbacteria bacterium]
MTDLSKAIYVSAIVAVVLCGALLSRETASAQSANELRSLITENNKKIEDLQKQIDQYSTLLNATSKEAQTLKTALKQLELTQKKLETNLKLTSTQISKTALTLEELEIDIDAAEKRLASTSMAMSETIRNMSQAEDQSAIEELLKSKSISDTWDYVNSLRTINGQMKIGLEDLKDEREFLGAKLDQAIGEKAKLEAYRKTLSDQTKVVEQSKAQKDQLLKDTQNKEASYKAILNDKIKLREQYEKELFDYESKLKITIDPSAVPDARPGLLSWPLSSVSITQYFGKTSASKRLYTSGTHNGIDLRASVGTQVRTALSGTVTDTEAVKHKSGCQYGKFVLIKHGNGLSTIYGHLSVVSVKPGDTVVTGDVIGYSGDTGYATGPHLHMGLYATEGIRIVDSSTLGSSRCAGIKTVAAPPTAYLDPMAYLPKP